MPRGYSNKFNRGEVDEGVLARDDVERIHNSGSLMDNFMPQRIGPMVYRPGTEYLGDALVNESHFLMAFVDDGTVPTILEFSQSSANPSVESLRFWLNGELALATATVDTITNGGFTGSITGWTDDSSGSGSSAHDATNDRLDLTGGIANGDWGRAYQTLTTTAGERTLRVHVADTPMLIQIGTGGAQSTDIFTDTLGFGVHLLTFTADGTDVTVTLSNDKPYSSFCDIVAYESAGALTVVGNMVTDISTTAATLQTLRYTQINDVMFITDGAYELSGFSWPFWIIKRRGNKSWSFELPNTIDGPFGPINLTSTTLTPGATSGDTTLTASNDFFDFSGSGKSTYDYYQLLHGDVYGICQVTSVQSTTVANVRVTAEFGGTTATTDWWKGLFGSYLPSPTSAEIFEGRLFLAGGSRLYGSVSDLYTSFDEFVEGDSAAITKTIGFGPVQDVSWLLGGDVLMMGLSSEEVQISSNGDRDAVTAFNANVRRGSNKGSAKIKPQVVDQIIYFVNRALKKVYALSGLKGEQIAAHDTTLLHPEICAPGIKRIVYSSEPEPRMYCLLTNGQLRVLLFDNVEEVTAWSRITLGGGGTVEDLVSAPTGDEDNVYMVVERSGTRYIERLAKFSESAGGADSRHYDSHVYEYAPGATFGGLAHLEGLEVYVWADGVEKGRYTVSSGSINLLESTWLDVVVGLRHTATWTSNKLARYVTNSVLNYRKRVVQIGLVLRAVALRNFKYGPSSGSLQEMPDVDQGRPRAPTTEPEPTIIDTITGAADGGITVRNMRLQDNYLFCACDTAASAHTISRFYPWEYYDGQIYNLGGLDASSTVDDETWKVSTTNYAFSLLTVDPSPGANISTALVGDVIYINSVSGGGDGFRAYDIGADTWDETLAQSTAAASYGAHGGVPYDGKVYLWGSQTSRTTELFEVYDTVLDSWSYPTLGGGPSKRTTHAMAAPQTGTGAGKFYVYSGIDAGGYAGDFWEYDITGGSWTSLSFSGAVAKEYSQMVAPGNGKLYVFGGSYTGGAYDTFFRIFDITGGTWSLGGTGPVGRQYHGMTASTTKIWVYGGRTTLHPNSLGVNYANKDMWEYDIATDTWTEVREDPNGITSGGGALRVVDVSEPDAMTATTSLNLDSDVSADNLLAYGVALDDTHAYFLTREESDSTLNRGIAVVNIETPTSPSQVDYLEGGTNTTTIGGAITKQGDYIYVVSHSANGVLDVIDCSDPTAITLEATGITLTYDSNPVNSARIEVDGYYLYVPWEDDLHIIDISDPTSISEAALVTLPSANNTHCLIDNQWLYVLDPTAGSIRVYSLDSATAPTLVGSLTDSSMIGLTDIIAFSPWVYLVAPTKGFVVDFRTPTAPTLYATYTGFTGVTSLASSRPNVLFSGSNSGTGTVWAADQRSWLLVDYDEMSFEFNGTYDTDSRITIQATGPAQVLAVTYEAEDIDNPTDGSDRLK